jgi:4-hydroxy-2-oxoheptanedioate aldolase
MINSRVLQKLTAGEVVRMVKISRVTDPWLFELAGRTGFDAIWFDMEHRDFGYDAIGPIAVACRSTGVDLVVRILKTGYSSPMRVLEAGANGVLVPHCRSAEEAREWVRYCRFPPLGDRSFDGVGADADYGLADPLEYLAHANEQTMVAVQIEDREAVESVEEIAAVEGIDLFFIGPKDLSISFGVPMQTGHPAVRSAVERVAAAAERNGRWWGMATDSPETARWAVDAGARLITCGSDHGWLVRGLQASYEQFRRITVPAGVSH